MIDQLFYDYALKLVGQPYRWGGDDTIDGFDCSGLVIELLQASGVLPANYDNTAAGLFKYFIQISPDTITAKFGTLCFFGKSSQEITHIGMALDDYRMIEAGGGGSRTKTRKDAATQNAYVRIRPIQSRADLVALIHPPYEKAKNKLAVVPRVV